MAYRPIDFREILTYNYIEVIILKKNWLLVAALVSVFFAGVLLTLGTLTFTSGSSDAIPIDRKPHLYTLAHNPHPSRIP